MRQNDQRGVSPLVTEPKWPEGYVAVLREAGAQEKTIPYCVGWVRRFFGRFPGRKRRELGRAEIERFLSEVAAAPASSNWLVQQARDSLELYYEKFRGIALEPRGFVPVTVSHAQSPVSSAPPVGAASQAYPASLSVGIQNTSVQYSKTVVSVKAGASAGRQRSEGEGRKRTLNAERPTLNVSMSGAGGEGADSASRRHYEQGRIRTGGDAFSTGKCNWEVLEERLRDCLRVGHYAYATEQTYVGWVRRYVVFHGWRRPSALEAEHVHAFLRHLAVEEQVASSTQNQAA